MTAPLPTSSPEPIPVIAITGGADDATVAAIAAVVEHLTVSAQAVAAVPAVPSRSLWLDSWNSRS